MQVTALTPPSAVVYFGTLYLNKCQVIWIKVPGHTCKATLLDRSFRQVFLTRCWLLLPFLFG